LVEIGACEHYVKTWTGLGYPNVMAWRNRARDLPHVDRV
jgi:hypothetical protein